MATIPYLVGVKWTIDVDPNDKNYVVGILAKDLTDRATTISAVSAVTAGVTVLEGPTAQGTSVISKVTMDTSVPDSDHSLTLRVVCANTEQFDRTIYFNLVDN